MNPIKLNISSDDLMKQGMAPSSGGLSIPTPPGGGQTPVKINVSSQDLTKTPPVNTNDVQPTDNQSPAPTSTSQDNSLDMGNIFGQMPVFGKPIQALYNMAKERYPALTDAYNIGMGTVAAGIGNLFISPVIQRNAQNVINNPNSSRQDVANATAQLQKANDFNQNMFNFIAANTPLGNENTTGGILKDMAGDTFKTGVNLTVDRMLMGKGTGSSFLDALKGPEAVLMRSGLTGLGQGGSEAIKGNPNALTEGVTSGVGWGLLDGMFSGLGAWGGAMSASYGKPFLKYATTYLDTYAQQLKESMPMIDKLSQTPFASRVVDIYNSFKNNFDTQLKDNVIPAYEKGTGLDRPIDENKVLVDSKQATRDYIDSIYQESRKLYAGAITNDTKATSFTATQKWIADTEKAYEDNIPPEIQNTIDMIRSKTGLDTQEGMIGNAKIRGTISGPTSMGVLDLENLRQQVAIKSIGNKSDRILNDGDHAIQADIESALKSDPEKYTAYQKARDYWNTNVGEAQKNFYSTILSAKGGTQAQDIIDALLGTKENLVPGTLDKIFATNPQSKADFQQLLIQEMKARSMVPNPVTGIKEYDPQLLRDNSSKLNSLGLLNPDTMPKVFGLSHAVGTDFDSFLKLNGVNPDIMKGINVSTPEGETPIVDVIKNLQGKQSTLEDLGQLKKYIETNPSEVVPEISKLKGDAQTRVMSQLTESDKATLGLGVFDTLLSDSFRLTDGKVDPQALLNSINKLGGGGAGAKKFVESIFGGTKDGEAFMKQFNTLVDLAKTIKKGANDSPEMAPTLLHAVIGTFEAAKGWVGGSAYHFGAAGLNVMKMINGEKVPQTLEELYSSAIADPKSGVKQNWFRQIIQKLTSTNKAATVTTPYTAGATLIDNADSPEAQARRQAATPPDWFNTEFKNATGEDATMDHFNKFKSTLK
jgi:hypothetical protein